MTVSIAFVIGVTLILAALILVLRLAFKTDFVWGLLGLLVVPLFVFMLVHPGKNKFNIALMLIGVMTSGLALWGGADRNLGLKAIAESLGVAELPGFDRLRPPLAAEPVPAESITEEAEPEAAPKKETQKKAAPKPAKRKPRFREASAGELKHLAGALFRGTTYDGRKIGGRIIEANEDEVTLSRAVPGGSASFTYRLDIFREFLVASP